MLKGEEWRIQGLDFFNFWLSQTQAVLPAAVTAMPADSYCCFLPVLDVALSFDWKKCADLWKEPFSQPAFDLSLPCWGAGGWGWSYFSPVCSWRSSTFPVSVPHKYCYFSCPVCWGTASHLFFLQKGRKANLEKKPAGMSSVMTWPLCQALACWQLQGGEWVRPSCSWEERRKEILIWLGLHLPSLLFPSILLLLGEPQLLLHIITSPHSSQDCQALACAAFCPLSSTQCNF